MQNAGTLRKRARRPLVKVNGLATLEYDEIADHFDIRNYLMSNNNPFTSSNYVTKAGTDLQVKIAMAKFKGLPADYYTRAAARITRDPMYHTMDEDPELGLRTKALGPKGGFFASGQVAPSEASRERPHLLSKGTYMRIRIIMFFGMLCLNVPWIWNKKTHRIDRWSPFWVKVWRTYWYFTTVQSLGLITYQIYCLFGIYSSDLESYRGIFAYSLIIYWYACHLGYKTCIFFYEDRMRKYLNKLMDFNQEYVEKYLVHADKYIEFSSARLIMKFSIPAAATQITNSLFFFLILPSAPYYLTSKIDPINWYSLIPGIIQDLTLIGQTILTYITVSWIQIAHAASMEFWLREMHKGSDSEYTSDAIRTIEVALPTYRSIQLLCAQFNECMAPLCIPVWKFSVAFGFIPCGYLWIRSMNQVFLDEFPGILVYPFGTVNCFTMGFGCLQMAAEMYDIANSFIYSWSKTKQKDFRRILLSCPTVKVKVGRSNYFITASTTITFFQVMTGYIIDCLLTFP